MAMKVRYNVMNGEVFSETRAGVRKVYVPDALGNTVAMMDNTGTITDTFSYFPSGTVASRTGTTATPFLWNGGSGYFTDSSTRKYVRARNYFNSTGRWGSQDPIGFRGGDYNLYRYVGNRFVVRIDPNGLSGRDCILDPDSMNGGHDYNPDIIAAIKAVCLRVKNDDILPYTHGKLTGKASCTSACLLDFYFSFVQDSLISSGAYNNDFILFLILIGKAEKTRQCMKQWCPKSPKESKAGKWETINKYNCQLEESTRSGPCKDITNAAWAFEGAGPSGSITYCQAGLEGTEGLGSITGHELLHLCTDKGTVDMSKVSHQAAYKRFGKCVMSCKPA